jgi:cytidylate kinase
MRVTVSGLPGSGTTSLARYLAAEHNLDLISAGEVFRQMAKEREMDLVEFGRLASEDSSIDRLIDERQKEIAAERNDIIVEGRLSGWFIGDAELKIWLTASLECRIRRILARDVIENLDIAKKTTRQREECEAERYRTYYDIDIGDLSPYHMVLNSERWGVEELGAIVDTAIRMIRT